MAAKKPSPDEPKSERFNMFISKSELDAIDEWAWKNRIRSKSDAVRRLVQIGLRVDSDMQELADAVFMAAGTAKAIDDDWFEILEQEGKYDDLTSYAKRVTVLLGQRFPALTDYIFDASNRMVDFARETAPFSSPFEVSDAILMAREARSEALERRKAWREEDEMHRKVMDDVKRDASDGRGKE